MLHKLILLALSVCAFAAPRSSFEKLELAKECDPDLCKLPDCLCASTDPPAALQPSEIPQLVLLTFDDAVNVGNIQYYKEAFYNRTNPNDCPVSTTYFVSHEYTDYSLVHDLWVNGHEIALHSITHQTPALHWQELDVEGYKREFVDQLDLVSHFANIARSDIKGMRLPFLQLAGNNSFQMIQESDLMYDSSWPTLTYIDSGLFPYTLDYKTFQDCAVGPCPTASLPGVWVMPMVDWLDDTDAACGMVDSCANIAQDVEGLLEFMKRNFHRHYDGSRSPFGFYVHAAWFNKNENNYIAYKQFLDYLGGLNDVYLISLQSALDWMKNPTTASEYMDSLVCKPPGTNTCGIGKSCRLFKGDEERYMTVCSSSCPTVYPWLGNPLGNEE